MNTSSESDLELAPLPQFALWAAEMLGLEIVQSAGDQYALQFEPVQEQEPRLSAFEARTAAARKSLRAALQDQPQVAFSVATVEEPAAAESSSSQPEPLAVDGELIQALAEALRLLGPAVHCVPRRQPTAVSDLAGKLFSAYRVDEGRAHLAGCFLEDRPILRLTFRCESNADAPAAIRHEFFSDDGQLCDADWVEQLELNELAPREQRRPEIAEQDLQAWINAGRQTLAAQRQGGGDALLAATVVWCKYAQGKIAVVIGSAAIEFPFAAWARQLSAGLVKPPPYRNPHTGSESYHLAATDDGRIVAAEDVQQCSQTGERLLRQELEQCSVTGRWAKPEFLADCTVTDSRILKTELAVCRNCQQPVSPTALRSGVCEVCQSLKRVSKADPRIARLLGERPELDRWRTWQIAEAATYYVLVASGLMNRLLLVLGKETLSDLYLARGSRLSKKWTPVPAEQRSDYLK